MAEEELLPSEVRKRILAEHDKLRGLMAEVRETSARARQNGTGHQEFADASQALLTAVAKHLDLEDEILVPTLETIDAWGPERAKRLATEHENQRQILTQVSEQLARGEHAPDETIERMETFVDRLEKDMALEEKTSLDEELLREFPIRVDFGGA